MVLGSFSEAASLGALLPFIWFLSGDLNNSASFLIINEWFGGEFISNQNSSIFILTFLFLGVFLIANLIRTIVLWGQIRLSQMLAADLAINIYSHALGLKYQHHVMNNSSKAMSGVLHKANSLIVGVIFPILTVINAVLVFAGIFISLLFIHATAALSSSIFFGAFYLLILYFSKVKIKKASVDVNFGENKIIQILQEGYNNIQQIIISGSREFFVNQFEKEEKKYRRAVSDIQIYSTVPKIIAETLGVFTIVGLAIYLKFESQNFIEIVPILGALALGAQRLLPVMQMVYSSLSLVRGHAEQVTEIINTLALRSSEVNVSLDDSIAFSNLIRFENVSLDLSNNEKKQIIKDVNIVISKSSKTVVYGKTGSGKSSFIHVLSGLFLPTKGRILVDGIEIDEANVRAWQKNISLVPQETTLLDGTIAENIAFGVSGHNVDVGKIKEILEIVDLRSFVETLPDGVNTRIGENGSLLSGGQRQRIGIARGLYRGGNLLVLDEATSALDEKTENKVLDKICRNYSHLTIVMVTHNKDNFRFFSSSITCERGFLRQNSQ